jgi:hypothetical protein
LDSRRARRSAESLTEDARRAAAGKQPKQPVRSGAVMVGAGDPRLVRDHRVREVEELPLAGG